MSMKEAIARLKAQSVRTSGDDPIALVSDIKKSDPYYEAVVKSRGARGTAAFTIKTGGKSRTVFGKSYVLTDDMAVGQNVVVAVIILPKKGDLPAKPWVNAATKVDG